MATALPEADRDDPADDPVAPPPRRSRRLLVVAVAVVGVALVGGGVAFSGLLGSRTGGDGSEGPARAATPPVFHTLPDLLVSLNTDTRRPMFLKVRVTLELADATDVARVEQVMPRIIDFCQVYLRELRPEDLQGSAGTVRLREELLRRINAAAAPTEVRDVLFSELLLQ